MLRFRMSILNYRPCSSISYSFARSQATRQTIDYRRGSKCSWSTSKRSTDNPFAVHTDRVNSYSPDSPRVVTDLFSPIQIRPPHYPVMPYNGFATVVDGEKASFH